MRRILRLFFRDEPPPVQTWMLTKEQHRQLLELLSEIGLNIVEEARGPVPLMTFGRRVLERLESPRPVPLPHFADALKRIIRDMQHDRLRVMSPSDFVGVGYVYNAQDPDTYPVRSANR
ncbi:MAG: hypothetical protein QOF78_839 [Phycisphaerales bacterium]|jgi:hypothetical protein|nr:hypothetical protein [Phycisphaerales bacterium]